MNKPQTSNSSSPRNARQSMLQAELRECLAMAVDSIASHKLRSGLTLLGILIGVFSIILVMTILRVLDRNAEASLSSLGPHTFKIQKTPAFVFQAPETTEDIARRKDITLDQGRAVQARARLPVSVAIQTTLTTQAVRSRHAETNPDVPLLAASPEVFTARNWTMASGRSLQPYDMDGARLVCVLGSSLADKLFGNFPAIGETVTYDKLIYTVVGTLQSKGQLIGDDQDNFIVIPLSTGLDRYGSIGRSLDVMVQAAGQDTFDDTVQEVRSILRTVRKVPPANEDDFEIVSNDSIIAQFRQITTATRAGAGVISSVALCAAGVGIMNIMLISVTERTREIGIRRAVGARRRTILLQFITEAILLCLIGGVAGAALGVLCGNVMPLIFKTPAVLPIDWIFYGLAICCFVGLVFGVYPALKASRVDPISALRYE